MSVRNGMAFCAGGDVAVMVRDINGGKAYPCSICHNQFIVEGCIFLLSVYCLVAHFSSFFFFLKFFVFFIFSDLLKVFSYFPLEKCPFLCKHVATSFAKCLKGTFAELKIVCYPCVCIMLLEIRCKKIFGNNSF